MAVFYAAPKLFGWFSWNANIVRTYMPELCDFPTLGATRWGAIVVSLAILIQVIYDLALWIASILGCFRKRSAHVS